MTKMRRAGLIVVLVCSGLSLLWGCFLGWSMPGGPLDFQAVYYGSRTLVEHHNPYQIHDVEEVFQAHGRSLSELTSKQHDLITLFVNTPATLLLVAPLTVLPLLAAQVLWLVLISSSLILAGYLIWDIAASSAPTVSACLVGFLLLNCQVIFAAGNTAAIVVGLCVIAAWCFLKNRYVPFGIACMAVSLVIKPHDAGLVWLFFLITNRVDRKRALQTVVLAALFGAVALFWISSAVPGWLHDWQSNLAAISAPGAMNDPRPAKVNGVGAGNVISLQAVFSVFNEDARFFNLASYLVCAIPILLWAVSTIRSGFSQNRAWLALAAIVPLTMLITYHRVYDAKLLLLTIPACAMLWAKRGSIGKTALILTSLGIVLNADVPLATLNYLTDRMQLTTASLTGQLTTVFLARPNQEILVAMGLFYLWVYWRSCKSETGGDLKMATLERRNGVAAHGVEIGN